jgi:hypothetical protein
MALLSLAALATAFPSDPVINARAIGYTGYKFGEGINFTRETAPQRVCPGPSFINEYRSHSGLPQALTHDCRGLELAWRASPVRGTFALPGNHSEHSSGFHTILYYKTCNLSVSSPSGYEAYIGDTDIKRILYTAMQRASHGSLMSAEGRLPCPDTNGLGHFVVTWQVYGIPEASKINRKGA